MMIQVRSVKNGEIVNHPLLFLEGAVNTCLQSTSIEVFAHIVDDLRYPNGSSDDRDANADVDRNTYDLVAWPVVDRSFKAFVLLKEGHNCICIKYGFYTHELMVIFSNSASKYKVQPLYIVCANDEGRFQAPIGVDNTVPSALSRIGIGCLLMQCFTAADMHKHLLGARTFTLPLNHQGMPDCLEFKIPLTTDELASMSDREIWKYLAKQLMESDLPNKHYCKFIAFLSCTRYSASEYRSSMKHADILAAMKCHVALGGGGLAILGTGTLHTWATRVADIVSCFLDERLIDQTQLMDDSAYRHTYWANFSTGLGSALHELGHTFDLYHTSHGIMGRGFDNIHRFFVLPHARPVKQPDAARLKKLLNIQKQVELQSKEMQQVLSPKRMDGDVVKVESGYSLISNACFSDTNETHSLKSSGKDSITSLCDDGETLSDDELLTHSIPRTAEYSPQLVERFVSCDESEWAPSSAVMLRYSRWFLDRDELMLVGKFGKPCADASVIDAPAGVRTVQLYCKCQGRIIGHLGFLNSGLKRLSITAVLAAMSLHCEHCCTSSCMELHVRDSIGHHLRLPVIK